MSKAHNYDSHPPDFEDYRCTFCHHTVNARAYHLEFPNNSYSDKFCDPDVLAVQEVLDE